MAFYKIYYSQTTRDSLVIEHESDVTKEELITITREYLRGKNEEQNAHIDSLHIMPKTDEPKITEVVEVPGSLDSEREKITVIDKRIVNNWKQYKKIHKLIDDRNNLVDIFMDLVDELWGKLPRPRRKAQVLYSIRCPFKEYYDYYSRRIRDIEAQIPKA